MAKRQQKKSRAGSARGRPPTGAHPRGDSSETPKKTLWKRLFSLPGALLVAALTAVVTFAATAAANYVNDRIQARNPVSVSVETDPALIPGVGSDGQSAVIPASVTTKGDPGPLGCEGFYRWQKRNGGISEGKTTIQLVIQGNISDPVLVTGLRVKVDSRGAPLTGIPADCPTAGTVEFHDASVDLDAADPQVTYPPTEPKHFGISLTRGESEAFILSGLTQHYYCTWTLQMDLVVKGAQREIDVSDHGKPFQTTAATSTSHWSWNYRDAWLLDRPDPSAASTASVPSSIAGDRPLPPLP